MTMLDLVRAWLLLCLARGSFLKGHLEYYPWTPRRLRREAFHRIIPDSESSSVNWLVRTDRMSQKRVACPVEPEGWVKSGQCLGCSIYIGTPLAATAILPNACLILRD
jgi:hypothetical protein